MDPISMILQALQAGTVPDVGYEAMDADEIMDRYGAFTDLLGGKFADSAKGQELLEQYAAAPDLYEGAVIDLLEENRIDQDADVLDAARNVLELLDVRGAMQGDYSIDYDDEDLERFV